MFFIHESILAALGLTLPWKHTPYDLALSRNTVLRSIEVPVRQLERHTKDAASTIATLTFSEVIIFFEKEISHQSVPILAYGVRKLHEIYGKRMAFFFGGVGGFEERDAGARNGEGNGSGLYDFLPYPPSVFSRTLAKCHPRYPSY